MNRILGEDIYGSSPLTRGKPSTPPVMWYTDRLIPAHAGKTITGALGVISGVGSSPLTRGKQRP